MAPQNWPETLLPVGPDALPLGALPSGVLPPDGGQLGQLGWNHGSAFPFEIFEGVSCLCHL